MVRAQRGAAHLVAAIFAVAATGAVAACGGDEVVSDTDQCLARVPQDRATLRAVVEPVIEPRFRDSMNYGDDCDSGEGAFVEWDVTGAAQETIETFKDAGWTAEDSDGLDPMVADVRLTRKVHGETVGVFIACVDDGACDAAAGWSN